MFTKKEIIEILKDDIQNEQLFEYADVIGGCLGKKYGSNAKKQIGIDLKKAAVSREEEMNNLDIPFGLG